MTDKLDTDFSDIDIVQDNVKLTWEYLGEGFSGDYDEDDPNDEPLLRFSLSYLDPESGEWESLDDASYCTALPINTPIDELMENGKDILMSLNNTKQKPSGYKRILEQWSWLGSQKLEILN